MTFKCVSVVPSCLPWMYLECAAAPQVAAHYELMEEFDVHVPPLDLASFQSMDQDYGALRDALWNADTGKDKLAERFRRELIEQEVALGKEVLDVKLLAQNDMVLDDSQGEGCMCVCDRPYCSASVHCTEHNCHISLAMDSHAAAG